MENNTELLTKQKYQWLQDLTLQWLSVVLKETRSAYSIDTHTFTFLTPMIRIAENQARHPS